MLYVHAQMGDGRAGELDPSVLSSNASALYARISRDATKFHGPYKFEINVPGTLKVSKAVTATMRVLATGGAALPNTPLTLSALGAGLSAGQVKTDALGVSKVTLTPTGRTHLKTALPTHVWSRHGPARLVLVTCGSPFDHATGHYRDNIVLTAVPV